MDDQFGPATNGTEQRLDAVLAELRALRGALLPQRPEPPPGTVELREPVRPRPRRG